MKILISFLIGLALGAAVFLALVFYNPLYSENDRVPTSDNTDWALALNFNGHLSEPLAHTHSGSFGMKRVPADVEELWHPSHKAVHAIVHTFTNDADEVIGVGVKLASWSEESRILPSKILLDSSWSILLPGAGSLFVDQQENYWPFLQKVLLPSLRADGNTWRGKFSSDMTVGPGRTGEAIMIGASGVLREQRGVAKESLAVSRFAFGAQHTTGSGNYRHRLTLVADQGIDVEVAEETDSVEPSENESSER